mgnify:CR=1 FL=1
MGQEFQIHPRATDDVGDRVQQVVPRQVRNHQPLIVEDDHEPRGTSLRGHISRAIGRRGPHQDERSRRDERPGMRIEGAEDLLGNQVARHPAYWEHFYGSLQQAFPDAFGAIVLDESSILKSFAGRTRNMLMDAFRDTPYKLAATATPSPNDHMELGNHAEFLGVMRQQEMLSKWFINDTSTASQDWRLKGHAVDDFWRWVACWSRCATLPSDLGGDDTGYVLPEIDRRLHTVQADIMDDTQGMLFRIPEMSATSFHKEKKLTLQARCDRAAELASHDKPVTVWCETNDESAMLAKMIDGAVEVRGDLNPDEKERRLLGFADGDYRVIVTKPKLAGFGVNWQHCAHAVFASISFSYEQHYQAVRRSHRFGQTEQVVNDIVIADTEAAIWQAIHGKSEKHDEMKRRMSAAMKRAQKKAGVRVRYDRPLDLAFPNWLKTKG